MIKLSQKYQKIISFLLQKTEMRSSEIHKQMIKSGENISLVTIKRTLSEMAKKNLLVQQGAGRSTSYRISPRGRIFADVDAKAYMAIEPDKRYGLYQYNFELLKALSTDLFNDDEIRKLETATVEYNKRTADLSETIRKKELERLVIELSWKSSRIEGNTYTLLDTEKLILENKEAPGHNKKEAQMILNHKDAFNYIQQHSSQFKTVNRKNLEELHSIIVKDLSVSFGFRSKPVGVTGSIYRPPDNIYQITEAVSELSATISKTNSPYDKVLMALLSVGYIQPFEDGNKRTSRLMANALLLSHSLAPLSYRSVNEDDYRSATLVFYELNSVVPMKKIFVGQYEFSAKNYAVK